MRQKRLFPMYVYEAWSWVCRYFFCVVAVLSLGNSVFAGEDVIACQTIGSTNISYGQIVNCSIDPINDTDVFLFSGSVGEKIAIFSTTLAGDGAVGFQVFDPDDVNIANFPGNNFVEPMLTKSGTYKIIVWDRGSNQTLDYALIVERLTPPAPTSSPIAFDVSLTDEINPGIDIDTFFFDAVSNDRISIFVTSISGNGTAAFQLVAPDGTILANFPGNNFVQPTLPQTGTYAIALFDRNGDQNVQYSINLQCIGGSCLNSVPFFEDNFDALTEFDCNKIGPATINYGDIVDCAIDPINDTDLFVFSANAGERIVIFSKTQDGPGSAAFQLFGPDNVVISNFPGNNFAEPALTQTGLHKIIMWDRSSNQTVDYAFIIERAIPTSPNSQPITFDQTLNGEINPPIEIDPFHFTANSGDTISISVSKLGGDGTPAFQLFDPQGTLLSNFPGNNLAQLQLTETGSHTILLFDRNGDQTVSYSVNLQCIGGSCL